MNINVIPKFKWGLVLIVYLFLSGLSCQTEQAKLFLSNSNSVSSSTVNESAEIANLDNTEGTNLNFEESVSGSVVVEPKRDHPITVLPVPFFSQAPFADWRMPYQEACEEAAMIMIAEYISGNHESEISAEVANNKILELISWEQQNEFPIDLTAEEVVKVLAAKFNLSAEVRAYNADTVKQLIREKHLVILPAAGRLLKNPHFRQPGPLYHMLVVKGYEGDEFITNDPGTKYGMSYRYPASVLAQAVHDWNGGEVEKGTPVMIVIYSNK